MVETLLKTTRMGVAHSIKLRPKLDIFYNRSLPGVGIVGPGSEANPSFSRKYPIDFLPMRTS